MFTVVLMSFLLGPMARARAEAPPVGILYGPQASFQETVAAVQARLEKAGYRCLSVALPRPDEPESADNAVERLARGKPRLIVSVGMPATTLALKGIPDVPVVFGMIPNARDLPLLAENHADHKRLAGVTTDAAPEEQVRWILKLMPQIKNVGVLYSAHTRATLEALKSAAQKRNLAVIAIEAEKDSFTDAIKELHARQCEGVIMLPDATVYNSVNVRALLLWGIRQKKPVWTFSDNIVKAGAFFGWNAEPAGVGKTAGELAVKILKGTKPPAVGLQYVRPSSTAINERTADLIGITVDEEILKTITRRYGKDQ
jgi:putative tryptophan/tyrosine transport system substrate-binding protein